MRAKWVDPYTAHSNAGQDFLIRIYCKLGYSDKMRDLLAGGVKFLSPLGGAFRVTPL